MDTMESEAVEQSIATQASHVMEQQLEVVDGGLTTGQVARSADPNKSLVPSTELMEPVSLPLPLPDRLQARLASGLQFVVTKLIPLVYLFGIFLLRMMPWVWYKMKKACGGGGDGDDADADAHTDLINFLTNWYLTDFFSLEKSRKVLCILAAGPSPDKANETAARLFKDTSKHFDHEIQVKLPEAGPADLHTILEDILGQINSAQKKKKLVQITKPGDHSARKDSDELIELIKKALDPARYLVLIPNLQGAETWKELGPAFPENEKFSRVIITTSRLDIAEECSLAESDLIYKVNDTSRKVLCILGGPSRDRANETAARLFKDTSKHFDRKVEVKLPEGGPADLPTILADILVQIGKSGDHSGKDRDELIELIKKDLDPVRYLVLISNIQGADTWKEIRLAFPENEKFSRVIITTSRLDIAKECSSAEYDLIYKVNDDDTADGKMSAEDKDEDTLLTTSCNDSLRNCSFYLSRVKDGDALFERASMVRKWWDGDAFFERAGMVRKWVAQELVEEEKMGHEHFLHLLSRGVIQEEQESQRFPVNPRTLPGLRQMSEQGTLATAHVDAAEEASTHHPMVATGEIPRLSLKCGPSSTTTSQQAAVSDDRPKPRTFLNMMMFTSRRKTAAVEAAEQRRRNLAGDARSFTLRGHGKELLRELDGGQLLLLDLQGCQDLNNDDVVDICRRLIYLKYLSIKGTSVSEIPEDIKNLTMLETLDLRETKVTVLPPEMYDLPRLEHMFVSDWLKMAEGRYSAQDVQSNAVKHRLLLPDITELDIRICQQLAKGDLEKLGNMENLRSLALTLVGLPTEQMVITNELPFKKLRVFSLDCRVPWITFREGAMPELSRLYLWLYAGPRGKTPSGTNHLKKLHQVTLRYSDRYEGSACVEETTRIMHVEDTMRARATTFVINGKDNVPQIQVPRHSKETLGWLVRKLLRGFYDCIPYIKRFRPKLAELIEQQPALAIPLLYLAFFIFVALLVMIAPLVIKVAIWVARRAIHAAALLFLRHRYGNRTTFIVSVPVLAYHLFCIVILAYCILSPAVQLVCATILGLLRLVLVYILIPLGYTLAALFSLLAPLGFVYYFPSLPHYLHSLLQRFFPTLPQRFFPNNLLPPLPKLLLHLPTGRIVFFIRILLLWLYFSPRRLFYSTVTAILLAVRNILEWLILGA